MYADSSRSLRFSSATRSRRLFLPSMVPSQSHRVSQLAAIGAAVVLVSVASFLLLRAASRVQGLFRTTGLHIVTRVMGLLLAAISVQFVLNGISSLLRNGPPG